jgi:hypothetical protein
VVVNAQFNSLQACVNPLMIESKYGLPVFLGIYTILIWPVLGRVAVTAGAAVVGATGAVVGAAGAVVGAATGAVVGAATGAVVGAATGAVVGGATGAVVGAATGAVVGAGVAAGAQDAIKTEPIKSTARMKLKRLDMVLASLGNFNLDGNIKFTYV